MARLFNGTSDLATVNAAQLTNAGVEFTIAAWVKSSATAAGQEIYGEGNTGTATPFFQFSFDTGGTKLGVAARDSGAAGAADQINGTRVVNDGVWHHGCVTQTVANLMALFVDGVADGTLNRTALSNGSSVFNTAAIAALIRTTTGSFFTGSIAHVATWSRQLAAADVASLARGVSPLQFAPDHYWPLYGIPSAEPDLGTATNTPATLTGTTSTVGPAATDLASFIASWGRRPVPMIKGPDTDKLLGMRGIYH